jgi:mRNA interferase RelE/StbE
MAFKLLFESRADKQLKKLDPFVRSTISSWIDKNLDNCENPRAHGKALTGDKRGYWRYRIGDYRLIAEIRDKELVIIMVSIAHRRAVYEN